MPMIWLNLLKQFKNSTCTTGKKCRENVKKHLTIKKWWGVLWSEMVTVVIAYSIPIRHLTLMKMCGKIMLRIKVDLTIYKQKISSLIIQMLMNLKMIGVNSPAAWELKPLQQHPLWPWLIHFCIFDHLRKNSPKLNYPVI